MDQIKRFCEAVTFVVALAFLAGACSPSATEVPKEVQKKVAVLFPEDTEIGIPETHYLTDEVTSRLPGFNVFIPDLPDEYFSQVADHDGILGRGADFLVTGFVTEKFDNKVTDCFIIHRATGQVRIVQMQGRKTLYEANIDLKAAECKEYRAAVATLQKVARDFAPRIVVAIQSQPY